MMEALSNICILIGLFLIYVGLRGLKECFEE